MKKLPILALTLSVFAMTALTSCGSKETGGEAQQVDTFYADQPVESGIYTADYYDITGTNARKGHFDGRVYFSLAPDQSVVYVCENGNRTKINYTLILATPFAPKDSNIYTATDSKGNAVTVAPSDSATYTLSFEKADSKIHVNFDRTPKTTAAPIEILEQINNAVSK